MGKRLIAGVVALVAIAACSSSSHSKAAKPAAAAPLDVQVVSSRPDMITGRSALLAVADGSGLPTVSVNGTPLKVAPLKKWFVVSGIPEGDATLVVTRGGTSASVKVTNSSIKGPVFSGPHMPLLACSTDENGLGAPTDADCSAPTKVDYLYVTTANTVQPLVGQAVPADAKQITLKGKQVPAIVRRERGVINRSVYWIDVLDPDRAGPAKDAAWNGRLVYRFGGGCGQSFGQGGLLGTSAEAPTMLTAGYAVATATFNTFQTQCNDVLSAETAMMVKSHFITEFGAPVHTIGEGASGGSIQIHLILQNYPGIIDAGVALLPFPDAISIAPGVSDCGLLDHYYATATGTGLDAKQRTAINGHAVPGTCDFWVSTYVAGIRPSDDCDPKIPKSKIYDPKTNPKGVRCDLVDANVNQFGRDPETGFAQRPLDNIGVQYGLKALQDKTITVDQFLDLNEDIGGFDIDGTVVPARETATEDALKVTYAKGRVSQGGGDQKIAPLIDINLYDDFAGDIHDRFRAFSLRDRLQSPNQVIWTRGTTISDLNGVIGNIVSGGGGADDDAIPLVDKWLDTGKMPPAAADNCMGAKGSLITGTDLYSKPGPCRDNYPLHGDPRTAAGAPLRNDILKCQLRPIVPTDYKVTFADAQTTRLQKLFPDGVCDWTKQGVGQVPLEGTWLHY